MGIVPVDTVKQVTRAQTSTCEIRGTLPREQAGAGADAAGVPLRPAASGPSRRRAADGFTGTDESSLVERLEEIEVSVVLGSDRNIKITKPTRHGPGAAVPGTGSGPERAGLSEYRTGSGLGRASPRAGAAADSGRRHDSCEFGLEGHSDADVLAHAITDAHAGRGGAGRHRHALSGHGSALEGRRQPAVSGARARSGCREQGYEIVNVDSTVILERPKLKDYRFDIRQKLAATLDLAVERVSVKFKTAERLGPVGEGKSAEAQAVVTIRKMEKDTESGHKYRV